MSNTKIVTRKRPFLLLLLILFACISIIILGFFEVQILGFPLDNLLIPLFWFGFIPAVITAIFIVPILIPGWRKLMQSNRDIRMLTALLSSLAAFITIYAMITWLMASIIKVFGDPNLFIHTGMPSPNDGAIMQELWWRQLFPLRSCFTADPTICNMADERIANAGSVNPIGSSLQTLGISALLMLPTSVILIYFSRARN